jgi:hypothetical protein
MQCMRQASIRRRVQSSLKILKLLLGKRSLSFHSLPPSTSASASQPVPTLPSTTNPLPLPSLHPSIHLSLILSAAHLPRLSPLRRPWFRLLRPRRGCGPAGEQRLPLIYFSNWGGAWGVRVWGRGLSPVGSIFYIYGRCFEPLNPPWMVDPQKRLAIIPSEMVPQSRQSLYASHG